MQDSTASNLPMGYTTSWPVGRRPYSRPSRLPIPPRCKLLPEDLGWAPNAEVLAAQQSALETFRLAETAVYNTEPDEDNWKDSDEGNEADSI